MKEQKFKIGEYVIDRISYKKFHKIADAELSTQGNWVYTSSDGVTLFQDKLNKWEPKECEQIMSNVSMNFGEYFRTYTVVLTIKKVLENKCEFKMSDDSILHITEIRPYTGEF